MRITVFVSAALLLGVALGGCVASTAPVGVLPRDPVPPPPSVSAEAARRGAVRPRTDTTTQRRALSVPGRAASPRP
ncbi:hypothetical protein [Microvirga splendida]|uniref:Uncharacterized protein n=1 Tax=Microvirga splendida TaxID=2795727 RepID=A0ABS0Y076_9HYPH|nr:hypothetical protein [Microvirga splendida]MBJ6125345.1 hypothetical protein [Microvirga splendida]